MAAEVMEALSARPGETAADCTLGFAGHARLLSAAVGPTGRLIGLDRDADNLPRAEAVLRAEGFGAVVSLHHCNFAALPKALAAAGVASVDCLLADLGVSSMQIDDAGRGFSYKRDGPLDMRMDRSRGKTAADLLREMPEAALIDALREFGDEPPDRAAAIARAVASVRRNAPPTRTADLARLVCEALGEPERPRLRTGPRTWTTHPAARTFQTLRMLVNREADSLRELLRVLPDVLSPGGRAAIISFHSGEDRLVKDAFRAGLASGAYSAVSDDPVRPTDEEKLSNPRSRSAKLRWARKG
jgi:16S rRNA (cytosine1402-N4)-methyltransferase